MVLRDLLFLLLLFLGLALFAALYYVLKYKGKEKLLRFIGAFCGGGFCALFLYLAVFSRSPHDAGTELVPFWSYRASVSKYYALDVFMQILENIAIFIPIGFLLPFAFGKRERGVLPFAFLLSLFAEGFQYAFSLGVCETDDIINNTLGAAVGFGLYRAMTAAEIKDGCFNIAKPRRFLTGLLPLFTVYEITVLLLVLRELMHIG